MKILITGPGSSGKTTTLNELERRGFKVTKEHAGEIWKTGLRGNEFDLAVLRKRIEIFNSINNDEIVFFDRSFPDSITFRKFDGCQVTKPFVNAIKKYRFDKVFILEPLEVYEHDGLREFFVKNKKEAEKWFKLIIETCKEYGYNAIIVKKMSVKERVDFILKDI